MKMSQDFISGFGSAVMALGREGDHRHVDWSVPYEFLKEQLTRFEPKGNDLVSRLRGRGELCAEAAAELERLGAMLMVLSEAAVIADSYGVIGSEFSTCLICGAGGAPRVPFKHTDQCAAGRAEETAERWIREHREEIEDLEKEIADLRAQTAGMGDGGKS